MFGTKTPSSARYPHIYVFDQYGILGGGRVGHGGVVKGGRREGVDGTQGL